ncbi:hypothetical protein BKM31_46360 [[Actinomadura] parvosata subsp. kistnae]|uniref:Uncharacterized protein n=1 Tax=[Actinomadura] parvosata subsp. kistnae TaxID=1909395 RepID=A0A1V0ACI1_9ACTN|nr:hypothetical protein BKM31_46360 [Nonomuraea sp. ATCC 55076]
MAVGGIEQRRPRRGAHPQHLLAGRPHHARPRPPIGHRDGHESDRQGETHPDGPPPARSRHARHPATLPFTGTLPTLTTLTRAAAPYNQAAAHGTLIWGMNAPALGHWIYSPTLESDTTT